MLIFFLPSRYRPIALIAIGVAELIAGIVVPSRDLLVIGGAFVLYGLIRGISRLRQRAGDGEDWQPSR